MLTSYDVAAIVGMLLVGTLGIEWRHNVTIDPPEVMGGVLAAPPVDCTEFARSQRMVVRFSAYEGGTPSSDAYNATLRQGPPECRNVAAHE